MYKEIFSKLDPQVSERERHNIARAVWEDLTNCFAGNLEQLDEDKALRLNEAIEQINKGLPVQYATNVAHFYGLRFYIDGRVLIPRPETEELVHWVLEENKDRKLNVLDIGSGSGIIPITLKHHRQSWNLTGVDVSAEALEVAALNAHNLKSEITLNEVDILGPKRNKIRGFDIIVSNPPYITLEEKKRMGSSVLSFEPEIALFTSDEQGMLFYKVLIEILLNNAPAKLYAEINEFRSKEVCELFASNDIHIEIRKDLQGKERMLRATI